MTKAKGLSMGHRNRSFGPRCHFRPAELHSKPLSWQPLPLSANQPPAPGFPFYSGSGQKTPDTNVQGLKNLFSAWFEDRRQLIF